jgi:hypothetical protein
MDDVNVAIGAIGTQCRHMITYGPQSYAPPIFDSQRFRSAQLDRIRRSATALARVKPDFCGLTALNLAGIIGE